MNYIEIKVSTLILERKAEDLQKIFENSLDDLLSEIRGDIREEFERQFDVEGDPKWQPLSPKYAERKRRIVGNKPILQFTERMKTGIIQGGFIEKQVLKFTYPTVYTRRHFEGYRMPKRSLNLNFVEKVGMKRIHDFTVSRMKQVGFNVKS